MPSLQELKEGINAHDTLFSIISKSHDEMRKAVAYAQRNRFISDLSKSKTQQALNEVQYQCAYVVLELNKLRRDYNNLVTLGAK
jgi:hypothetical protein